MAVKPYVKTAILQQAQPIVDASGRPVASFVTLINGNNQNLAVAINAIAALPEIQQALLQLDQATKAAQDAADAATSSTAAQQRETSLQSSYIDPSSVLAADPTTITIAPHTRYYPQAMGNPIAVPVNGGSVAATAPGDVDYVSYSDPDRTGGAVTYIVTDTPPTQTGDTHVVGAVLIPATGTADGGDGPVRPGHVLPREGAAIP